MARKKIDCTICGAKRYNKHGELNWMSDLIWEVPLFIKVKRVRATICRECRNNKTIREIEKQSSYRPFTSKYRVWVLDECFAPNRMAFA